MSPPHAFYVTTPIYYVNGRPHVGHAYTTIAADVLARWHRALGAPVKFLTGTDEHGQKVLDTARKRGMTPEAHCDDMVAHWKAAWVPLGIQYDRFLRTTDADHVAVVQDTLTWMWERDLIYRSAYEGWYSVVDEAFVTDKDVAEGKYDESQLQRITEVNYFFRMGRYQQALLDHLEANPDAVRPASRRNEVLGFLRRPLEDLCISRPSARMPWGIPLPFDDAFVTYVWFDALLNYLTATGWSPYPKKAAPDWASWWPASVQLVGKDILTTHAVYWCTMLLALGLPLPRTLFAHGWWTADGHKMSKSKGNVIDVTRLTEAFGADAVRYFFLREIPFGGDGAFSYEGFLTRYNADLANDFGNLVHRATSMTERWLGGRVPPLGALDDREHALVALAQRAATTWAEQIPELGFGRALEGVWELVRAGNKYIDEVEPWRLNREGDTPRLARAMRMSLEVCALAGALLESVMPAKAAELLARVGAGGSVIASEAIAGRSVLAALPEGAPTRFGDPLVPRFTEMPALIAEMLSTPQEAPVSETPPPTTPPEVAAAPERAPDKPQITYDDFAKVDLRAGTVVAAAKHPKADRLLVLTVDVGEASPRTIVAGIASKYAPEDLVGRQVVVVVNLAPAKLRGVESQGMLLAAGGQDVLALVTVDCAPGQSIK